MTASFIQRETAVSRLLFPCWSDIGVHNAHVVVRGQRKKTLNYGYYNSITEKFMQ